MLCSRYKENVDEDPEHRRNLNIVKGQLTGLCLFVTSTFGNGEPPGSAVSMAKWLDMMLNDKEDEVHERLRVEDLILENKVRIPEEETQSVSLPR